MATSSFMRNAFISTLAAVGAMTAANDAMAQSFYSGQCGIPMAQFNQALLAEGQRTIVAGNGVGMRANPNSSTGVDTRGIANGITATEDGRLGYHYEGNNPLGTPSTEVCVTVLTNVQLSDARRGEIPARAYLGGAFNDSVNLSARNGTYPMVVADTIMGQGENRRYGLPIVMFGNLAERRGDISTLPASGQPTNIVTLLEPQYTQIGLERLNARQASVEQNNPVLAASLN